MSDLKSKLWVEKYKPQNLSQYIFQNESDEKLINNVISNNLPGHILLSGAPGTGKTTISNLIISELNVDPADVLRINASDDNSVDMIRTKIIDFVTIVPNGDYRVIQLEEADYLSPNAQGALRQILEEYVDYAKFIFTCNLIHRIIPALKSRMNVHINFKSPEKGKLAKRVIEVLLAEKIKFDPSIIMKYVDICYPDLRKVIQAIQQNCVNGELLDPSNLSDIDDYKFKFLKLLEKDDWSSIRSIICAQVSNDEIESVYRFLYENLNKSKKFQNKDNWEAAQIKIADYLYRDALVWDREINISALFIELSMI